MKKNKLAFVATLFSILLYTACQSTANQAELKGIENSKETILAENKENVTYKIEGMACEFGCAKFIEKKVAQLDGVIDFKVDFESSEAKISYDNSVISNEEIVEFVEKMNDGQYKIKRIENTSSQINNTSSRSAQVKEIPVVKNFNLSFPKLITYFTRRL